MVFLRGAAQSERRVRHEASQRRFASLGQRDNCVFLALWCGPGVIVESALVLAEAKPRLLCLCSRQATRKRKSQEAMPSSKHRATLGLCLRCSRELFCFCFHRRSLVVLLLVCCLFAPVARWSLLVGVVFAFFRCCVCPFVLSRDEGTGKQTAPERSVLS